MKKYILSFLILTFAFISVNADIIYEPFNYTRLMSDVITSYSIHYTKLYDIIFLEKLNLIRDIMMMQKNYLCFLLLSIQIHQK